MSFYIVLVGCVAAQARGKRVILENNLWDMEEVRLGKLFNFVFCMNIKYGISDEMFKSDFKSFKSFIFSQLFIGYFGNFVKIA